MSNDRLLGGKMMEAIQFGGKIYVAEPDIREMVEAALATNVERNDKIAALEELLWSLYEGLYGHRKADNIDPFKTAVGGALEVVKAWRERGQPAEATLRERGEADRSSVIEECAKVCERYATSLDNEYNREHFDVEELQEDSKELAAQIRALKTVRATLDQLEVDLKERATSTQEGK